MLHLSYLRCCWNCIKMNSIIYLKFLIGVFNRTLSTRFYDENRFLKKKKKNQIKSKWLNAIMSHQNYSLLVYPSFLSILFLVHSNSKSILVYFSRYHWDDLRCCPDDPRFCPDDLRCCPDDQRCRKKWYNHFFYKCGPLYWGDIYYKYYYLQSTVGIFSK